MRKISQFVLSLDKVIMHAGRRKCLSIVPAIAAKHFFGPVSKDVQYARQFYVFRGESRDNTVGFLIPSFEHKEDLFNRQL